MSDTPAPNASVDDLPEQLQIRRDKRERLIAEGQQVYPVSVRRTHSLARVRAGWGQLEAGEPEDVEGR